MAIVLIAISIKVSPGENKALASFIFLHRKISPNFFNTAFFRTIWKSRHRHLGISIVIGICIGIISIAKILFLLSEIFLKIRTFIFFLVLSYGISTALLQMLISLRFPIHPSIGVHWCFRKLLDFRKIHPLVF